jgi:HK97 family phage prohead protease
MKQTRISHDEKEPLIRAEIGEENKKYFTGYAAVYNSRSRIIYESGRVFHEVLIPGCFDRVIVDEKLDVVLTINHQKLITLARTISGTLSLTSDSRGLKFKASVPDTQAGNDTWEMIKRGDYTDCSFAFSIEDTGEKWERDGEGELLHVVNEVSALYDVAICTVHGAYGATMVDIEKASRAEQDFNSQDKLLISNLQKEKQNLLRENSAQKEQIARLQRILNSK